VRRPNEVFLDEGQAAPEQEDETFADLSQEELLKQTVHIQHKPLKDPRDIKMLDPACGSMHFGLYAFDLFEKIYSEAWDIEAEFGYEKFNTPNVNEDESTRVEVQSLNQSYDSKEACLADVPKLIIEHNIYGVDIDPRAAQIAGLSLWLRAQKSWADNAIKPNDRPQVQRSNIVCAEPMPGEKKLLNEFTNQIQPRVLGQLVEEIFEKMELAGEAGTLLKIEEEIQSAIVDAKSQKDENILEVQGGLFGENKWEATAGKRYYNFGDVEDDFWGQAENLILSQLENYAELASGAGSGQKRMFAADAAKGFAFIDLCRTKFDVVLMNPPFGDVAKNSSSYIKTNYPKLSSNLFTCFVERGCDFVKEGRVGAITDATWIKKTDYKDFRSYLMDQGGITGIADFGWGVLDDANVATCAYICAPNQGDNSKVEFIGLKETTIEIKANVLLENISNINNAISGRELFVRKISYFNNFEKSVFSYDAPENYVGAFSSWDKLNGDKGYARRGYTPGDTFRFFRCIWETPIETMNVNWHLLNNGGAYKPIVGDGLMTAFFENEWRRYKPLSGFRLESADWMMGEASIGWGKRTDNMYAYPMPSNSMFSNEGHCYFPASMRDAWGVIGLLNSALGQTLVNLITGQHKLAGYVGNIPFPPFEEEIKKIGEIAESVFNKAVESGYFNENSPHFNLAILRDNHLSHLKDSLMSFELFYNEHLNEIDSKSLAIIESDGSFEKDNNYCRKKNVALLDDADRDIYARVVSLALGLSIGRWKDFEPIKNPFEQVSHTANSSAYSSNVDVFTVGESASKGENLDFDEEIYEKRGFSSLSIQEVIDAGGVNEFINNVNKLFEFHLKTHTKSRRQSPIYWPLQTPSGLYTVWIYFHSINEQTLFSCVNNFIEPKIIEVAENLVLLGNKPVRTTQEEKELACLQSFHLELKDLYDELLSIAKFWKPNLDDGVQINAAPLWKLFQSKGFQSKLNKTWVELDNGKYDWAYMAYNFWPERVLRKCHKDRSIAIAHDVESDFWEEVEVPVGKSKTKTKLAWQPKEMSESELNTYIERKIAQG